MRRRCTSYGARRFQAGPWRLAMAPPSRDAPILNLSGPVSFWPAAAQPGPRHANGCAPAFDARLPRAPHPIAGNVAGGSRRTVCTRHPDGPPRTFSVARPRASPTGRVTSRLPQESPPSQLSLMLEADPSNRRRGASWASQFGSCTWEAGTHQLDSGHRMALRLMRRATVRLRDDLPDHAVERVQRGLRVPIPS